MNSVYTYLGVLSSNLNWGGGILLYINELQN